MAHPYFHAVSSARKWGGTPEEYQKVHDWFDQSKSFHADIRHRALRHHAEGIFMAETIFGTTITLSSGKKVPVRFIGEQHVTEDLGWIPSVSDWLRNMQIQPWMNKPQKITIELELPTNAQSDIKKETTESLTTCRAPSGSIKDQAGPGSGEGTSSCWVREPRRGVCRHRPADNQPREGDDQGAGPGGTSQDATDV